ncbi:hypothetical protein [Ileibacterium valens]|uniref:hypothetical protein n=1 Tax=Ileibacterium valens TaxID=1862668 RepID=UPI00272B08FA|nr:hypothetical protein [Ileibacterium valens]
MKQVKKVKRNRKILFTVVIVAIIICAAAIGYLWFANQSRDNKYQSTLDTLEQQYTDYTTLVENTALPEGWSKSTLSALKEKALNAYDVSEITLYQNAVDGDVEAQKKIGNSETAKSQPETVTVYTQILKNLNAYPENLAKLAINDESLLAFVADYPNQKDKNLAETEVPVLEGDMTLINSLKAADPRWGYLPFGNSLFAQSGAPETALSMVFSYLLEDPKYSPAYFALWAPEFGYDIEPVKENDNIFGGASYAFGVNYTPLPGYEAYVNDSLSQGSVVIAELAAQDGSDNNNFVVIPMADENGNWVIYDPLSSELKKTVSPDDIKEQLVNVYAFWR